MKVQIKIVFSSLRTFKTNNPQQTTIFKATNQRKEWQACSEQKPNEQRSTNNEQPFSRQPINERNGKLVLN